MHTFKPKPVKEIFNDTIGVNFSGKKTKVRLWTNKEQYPFFETLPFHHSQKLEQETEDGYIFSIEVNHNFELERWILYYGVRLKVLAPELLKQIIEKELKKTLELYN
jgi:predicted DNA-binding transcriptional regulator YafY